MRRRAGMARPLIGNVGKTGMLQQAADAQLYLVIADLRVGADQMAGKVIGALNAYGRQCLKAPNSSPRPRAEVRFSPLTPLVLPPNDIDAKPGEQRGQHPPVRSGIERKVNESPLDGGGHQAHTQNLAHLQGRQLTRQSTLDRGLEGADPGTGVIAAGDQRVESLAHA